MAGRHFNQFSYSLEKMPVSINAVVDGNGVTSAILQQISPSGAYSAAGTGGFRGVKSVTRNGVGDWTIKLQDNYQRLIACQGQCTSKTAAAPVTYNFYVKASDMAAAGGATINVILYGAAIGTPVEASATVDRWLFEILVSNSTAM
jgi:archaellum component FlaG (FlaF/FlaG flagellin family)